MRIRIEVDSTNSEEMFSAIELLSTLIEKRESGKTSTLKSPVEVPETPTIEDPFPAKKSEYTVDDIRAKVSELLKDGKRTEVKDLLKQFGAGSVTKLEESEFINFMAAAEKL